MSLVGSLGRVAVGIAAAKGISSIMGRASARPTSTNATDAQPRQVDASSSVLGKNQGGEGLGSLLAQLAPGTGSSSSSSASASAAPGGLDALVRGLSGVATGTTRTMGGAPNEGSFTEALNESFQKFDEPKISPTPQQNVVAGLMLSAMLQAAKCDGRIDEGEKRKIVAALGGASREDIAFVNQELSAPVDVQALVRQVPKGLENQIYAVSAMGIDLDSQTEAKYLAALASALGIGSREVNAIHAKLGMPALFN